MKINNRRFGIRENKWWARYKIAVIECDRKFRTIVRVCNGRKLNGLDLNLFHLLSLAKFRWFQKSLNNFVFSIGRLSLKHDYWFVDKLLHSLKLWFVLILFTTQRPRIDLNKSFLPRPNTTTAWKHIPHRSNISKN